MFRTSPVGCIYFALVMLVLPLQWILAAIAAAVFHEACHAAAVRLCGGKIYGIRIGDRGAVMQVGSMSGWKALLCILAGPLGSLSLLMFARLIPRIALCALVQGMYNLLPIYPLDGGRILRCLRDMKNRP